MKNNNRILGTYEITYENNGFIQLKNLISDTDYKNILNPLKKIINLIESDNKGKSNEQSELIKQSLNLMFKEYNNCFTESSPLGQSIKTGIIQLPKQQGSEHKVSIKKIKYKSI